MATAAKKRGGVSEKDRKGLYAAGSVLPHQYLDLNPHKNQASLPRVVEKGLPVRSVDKLAEYLKMPTNTFVTKYIGIPKQTLSRRKQSGKFTASESDRVVRYARLLRCATDMMDGDEEAALRWLNSPRPVLENRTPLEYARTETGAEEVRHLIGRIEDGVWS